MIAKSLQKLNKALAQDLPELTQTLLDPVTPQMLSQAEEQLGLELPEQLKQWYLLHNGQNETGPGLLFGIPMISLARMLEEWQIWSDLEEEYGETGDHFSEPIGWIAEKYISKGWIPLTTDWAGNHIGIDLAPGELGIPGQVINFGRDEETKYVVAHSLEDLFYFIGETVEAGNYTVQRTEEGVTWAYGDGKFPHFHDWLARLSLPLGKRSVASKDTVSSSAVATTEPDAIDPAKWAQELDEKWQDIVEKSGLIPQKYLSQRTIYLINEDLVSIEPLRHCKQLRELVLSRNHLTNIEPLVGCTQLQKLYLYGNPLESADLLPLQQLPHLKTLIIGQTKVLDWNELAACPALRSLDLTISHEASIASLASLTQITALNIEFTTPIPAEALAPLGDLKRLKELTLNNLETENIAFLTGCTKLNSLDLERVRIKDVSAIAQLPRLTRLGIRNESEIGNLDTISAAQALRSFNGSIQHFQILKNAFQQKVDFSSINGSMTDAERDEWLSYNS